MKSLAHYIETIESPGMEDNMKPMRIMAEQTNGNETQYNTPQDRWSRRAKHPMQLNSKAGNGTDWVKGDLAIYEGITVEVVVSNGPNNTVGINSDGKTKMVRESTLTRIDEGVMGGVMAINPINRIMQLAGVPDIKEMEKTPENEIIEEADATNMFTSLFKANMTGEFRNNPEAARIATIGQILTGLESQVKELRGSIDTDLESKLNMAVGLGAFLIKTAREKLKPAGA